MLMMSSMWSFLFPETEEMVEAVTHDPKFKSWFRAAWLGHQDRVPRQYLDLWKQWSKLDLSALPFAYVGNGSSEVIRELLIGCSRIVVFKGEYPGYSDVAKPRGIEVVETDRSDVDVVWVPKIGDDLGTTYFISQPSAIDGEYWDGIERLLERLQRLAPRARVVIDVAYHGLCKETQRIPVDHPMVSAVIFSLSKVYGMYRWRVGGVCSRYVVPGLSYNHYFNSLPGLKVAIPMMERYGPGDLPRKYAPEQAKIVEMLIAKGEVPSDTVPSNVLLLARGATPHKDPRYNRAGGFRTCLSPGFEHLIIGDNS